jgi:ribose transport system permease protein
MSSPESVSPGKFWRSLGKRLVGGTLGPLIGLLLVMLFFAAWEWKQCQAMRDKDGNPRPTKFLTAENFASMATANSTVAVAALGMTVIIIAGGIDLSAGTALALCATVIAHCLNRGHPIELSIMAGIGTGCLTGLFNGALVSSLRVVPFIVTLGTMTIYLGIGKIIAEETTIRPAPALIPGWVSSLLGRRPNPEWLVVNSGIWLLVILAIVLACVLRYTVFGRYIYALGSNESTARLCGINVPMNKIAVYTLGGFFIGVAGLYQFARLGVGNPGSGTGLELKVIAAVVIGGASLNGGQGSVLGTLTGAAIMAVIASGCNMVGVGNPMQDIIIGAVIIVAVAFDQLRQRRLAS